MFQFLVTIYTLMHVNNIGGINRFELLLLTASFNERT